MARRGQLAVPGTGGPSRYAIALHLSYPITTLPSQGIQAKHKQIKHNRNLPMLMRMRMAVRGTNSFRIGALRPGDDDLRVERQPTRGLGDRVY